jgi:hypothetical protein
VFLHRLALALHRSVGEIETSMSNRELMDWQRFEELHEPLPDRLLDQHGGLLCSLIVNLVRSAEATPMRPADFYFIRDHQPAPPADDGMSEVDRQMMNWRGGS